MPPGPSMKCRLLANSAAQRYRPAARWHSCRLRRHPSSAAAAPARSSRPSQAAVAPRPERRRGCSGSPALRASACGLPSRPQGRQISTTAMTRNSTTSVSLENDSSKPAISCTPSQMQTASSSATSNAAMKAPGMLPMPPTTTTTNAAPMVSMSISRLAGSRGNCSAPPRPASSVPSAGLAVNSQAWLTPRAPTISRSCVAARTRVPKRVLVNKSVRPRRTQGPAAIKKKIVSGELAAQNLHTEPSSPVARGPNSSSGPHSHSAAS